MSICWYDATPVLGLDGLRVATAASNGGEGFSVAQGVRIGAVVGARSEPATQG